jgi:hypothetical protein
VFVASGTLAIPSSVTGMIVEAWGGGGGGAGFGGLCFTNVNQLPGGGGGAGGYVRAFVPVSGGQSYAITVGSGGGGGTNGVSGTSSAGTVGNDTTVALRGTALVTAKGGAGAPAPDPTSCTGVGGAGGGVATGGGAERLGEVIALGGTASTPTPNGTTAGVGGNAGGAGAGGDGGGSTSPQRGTGGANGIVVVTFVH